MWCAHCQAEVAAEVATDNRRIHCATCGSQIDSARGAAITDKTREARELLERWSGKRVFDPLASVPRAEVQPALALAQKAPLSIDDLPRSGPGRIRGQRPEIRGQRSEVKGQQSNVGIAEHGWRAAEEQPAQHHADEPLRRVDRPHSGAFATQKDLSSFEGERMAQAIRPQPRSSSQAPARIEPPHQENFPSPHFRIEPAGPEPRRRANWATGFGQFLAYGGVLGLTVGMALVVWGYFGGPAYQSYTPTGWLVATLGQMLMFLGVITIVSGGMEQTTFEVSRRIDSLGDKLLRIEQASRDHMLRGPSIPAERFADLEQDAAPREREPSYVATNAR